MRGPFTFTLPFLRGQCFLFNCLGNVAFLYSSLCLQLFLITGKVLFICSFFIYLPLLTASLRTSNNIFREQHWTDKNNFKIPINNSQMAHSNVISSGKFNYIRWWGKASQEKRQEEHSSEVVLFLLKSRSLAIGLVEQLCFAGLVKL